MTLNEVMKETADASREKTGKSELIKPIDFATEIKGITAGGGESASTIEYLDMTNVSSESWMVHLLIVSLFVKQQITLGGVTAKYRVPNTPIANYERRFDGCKPSCN